MSIYSPDSEVFGAKVLYAAMIAISAFVLFAAVASTVPAAPAGQDARPTWRSCSPA